MTAPRRKRPRDPAQLAKLIVDIATGEVEGREPEPEGGRKAKDPAAVNLGRRGGLKGGEARSETLTLSCRSEIARAAVNVRWKKSAPSE